MPLAREHTAAQAQSEQHWCAHSLLTPQFTQDLITMTLESELPSAASWLFCVGVICCVYLITTYYKPLLHIPISSAADQLNYHAHGIDNFVLFAEYADKPLEEKFHVKELARDLIWLTAQNVCVKTHLLPCSSSLGNLSSLLSFSATALGLESPNCEGAALDEKEITSQ